ncbi:MAG: CocE/NonD family hydrolase [Bacteroidota bacterium]
MKQHYALLLFLGLLLRGSLLSAQVLLEPVVDSIPMRDGKWLAADIYHPADCDSCPTLLIQTPYNRKIHRIGLPIGIGKDVDNMPFHVVIVDWRGFWGSLAAWKLSPNRGEDGYDVVEWIASQSWSDGCVGSWGPSALGGVQLSTIREHPPHLVCAIPEVAEPQFAYNEYYPGGVYRQEYGEQLDALGFNLSGILLANPTYNLLWSTTEAATFYPEEIDIPIFMVGGWYDHNIENSLRFFSALQTEAPNEVKDLHTFLIGPWVHGGNGPAHLGSVNQGELSYPLAGNWKDSLEWMFLRQYLLGDSTEWEQHDPIIFYQMGEHYWDGLSTWPPVASSEIWYLQADSSMSMTTETNGALSFAYDPRDPSPTHGGTTLRFDQVQGPYDQRDTVENRSDILLFSSPVLSRPVRVQGQISLNLYVSSDRPDTDIAVRLTNVYPDGRSMILTDDIHRMRFREGFRAADTMNMVPGQVYEVSLTLADIAHTFMPGHRIRLGITSSNYPKYALNLNNGGPMYVEGDTLIATNTIHTGGSQASRMIVPTVMAVGIGAEEISLAPPLKIYPNPARETIWITPESAVVQLPTLYEVRLFDLNGRIVRHQQVNRFPFPMTIDELPPAIYMMELRGENQVLRSKLVKR